MKHILTLFIILNFLASCGGGDKMSVDSIIESKDIETIRSKKSELVSEQNLIKQEIKKLDIALMELDSKKKIPYLTHFRINFFT
jgi:hypothetical protein